MQFIWISIQSDFGITMGELGRLSAQTDSKLIASTLMALKDIVSVEASSGESQFMTGAVETSSFGTFAIPVDDQSKLIMSYIISAESGDTVDDSTVSLVQSLCTNFGKQLIQFGSISLFASSGAPIPRDIIVKAFLNACVIVRLEYNLSTNARAIGKGYKEILDQTFNNSEEMNEAFNYIMNGNEWKKDNELWHDGFLTPQSREKITNGIANYIVYSLMHKQPSLYLYSPDPRNEPKRIYQRLKKEIKTRLNNPVQQIIKELAGQMQGKVEKYLDKIPLVDLHTSQDRLYNEFVRSSVLEVLKKNPFLIFSAYPRDSIEPHFLKLLPDVSLDHAGTILLKSLKPSLSESAYDYVKLFFDKFIGEMSGISLTQTAMDLLLAFSQEFIPSSEINENLKNLDIQKKWMRELSKFIGSKAISQLKVNSIDEGILLKNAASSAVVNTLAKTIADQFLFIDENPGEVLHEMVSFYLTSGPIIKVSSILISLLHSLSNTSFDVELITPLYQDFITAAAIKGNYQFIKEDKTSSIKRKKGELFLNFEREEFSYYQYLEDAKSIKIQVGDGNQIDFRINQFNENNFINLINDPELIVDGVTNAAERRIQHIFIKLLDKWIDEISRELNQIITYFLGTKVKITINDALSKKPYLPKQNLLGLKLGNQVRDIASKAIDQISIIWDNLLKEWDIIAKEIKQKKDISKKTRKKIEKICQIAIKSSINTRSTVLKQTENLLKEILKSIKHKKNEFKLAMRPTEDEILTFSYDTAHLLPKEEDVLEVINNLAETIDGLGSGELKRLVLSVSLSLFKKPPDSVLEYAYNEIIRGKISKPIKNALSNVNSKKEFENYFKEQAQNYANSVYEGLSKLIDPINKFYINKDGIITSDAGKITLQIGRIPISKYPRQKLIDDLFSFSKIKLFRETNNWLVSFDFTELRGVKSEEPNVVTFSDAVRYVHRASFNKRLGPTFAGLATVASLIEKEAGLRLKETLASLSNAIFNISN